ncbi:MAG TPA: hypothetical protein PK685_03765 [archaeon]|jgi:hypothetical protein|nr:hypothetical protein [archaeon]
MKILKLNQRGDDSSSESFRLLIAFVLAAAILVIIMNMIASTNKQSILISDQKLKEGVQSAAKSVGTSTKIPFIIEDLMLTGTITKRKISIYSGMDENCIGLIGGQGIEYLDNGDLRIKADNLKMNVWAYCDFWTASGDMPDEIFDPISFAPNSENCKTYCVYFFNKKPENSLYTENNSNATESNN